MDEENDGVVNIDADNFNFDFIEVHSSNSQSKSVKTFAAERRRLKPNRKHVASSNPVKALKKRASVKDERNEEDIFHDFNGIEDIDNDDLSDLNEIIDNIICKSDELGHLNEYEDEDSIRNFHNEYENNIKNGDKSRDQRNGNEEYKFDENLYKNEPQIIGRRGNLNTGKVKEREVSLSDDAKKALESKEDIHAATQKLRITEKDSKTGVATEKTNIYDGVKDIMLFHIKGARHVQTRLVEPKSSSLNSGDVFVLVTAKHVIQWNGKNCSIMEKARGAEVSSVIYQWKELRCNASNADVIDEGHEKAGSKASIFWKILGNKDEVKDIDDVVGDQEFEKLILGRNRFYEIKCADNEDEDAECWVELMENYSGKVPSKKWLQSDKAYVLDFGSEVYSWIGRHTVGAPRKKSVDIGLEIFNKGYLINTVIDPSNESGLCSEEILPRPNWCVYGRMAEKTENVLFRRKFYDWPDPVNVKVTTVEGKVHSQLTKEFSCPTVNVNLIPANLLMQPPKEPLMIVDGNFIGRGKGMRDEETLFKYGVTTTKLSIWEVSGSSYEELSVLRYGVLYSGEAYYLRWNYEIFRTGIRHLKGGKSRQEDTGKSRILFFFWQGKDCSPSEKGLAALRTIELSSDEGPQILVSQGKEPPAFSQLFDGKMIVHANKFSDDTDYTNRYRMYWVKNEINDEACLVEIKMCSSSLRSRGSFIIVDMHNKVMYIWHGVKSLKHTQIMAINGAKNLKKKTKDLHSEILKIYELLEGEEVDEFWNCFEKDEDYMSYLGVNKSFNFTPRCFSFDSLHGHFRHAEIISSSYHPDYVCPFPILQSDLHELSQPGLVFIDGKYKMYLWQGWWPTNSDEDSDVTGPNTIAEKHRFDVNRRLALQSIKDYAEKAGRSLSQAYIVFAGCEPLEFKNLFPFWEDNEEIRQCQLEAGRIVGEKLDFLTVLNQLEKEEYSLAELKETPLPEGVDPTRIEQYLNKAEFQKLFGLNKEDFTKLPRWKQIELKKKTGLF